MALAADTSRSPGRNDEFCGSSESASVFLLSWPSRFDTIQSPVNEDWTLATAVVSPANRRHAMPCVPREDPPRSVGQIEQQSRVL